MRKNVIKSGEKWRDRRKVKKKKSVREVERREVDREIESVKEVERGGGERREAEKERGNVEK